MDKTALLIQISERRRFLSYAFEELSPAEQVFLAVWELDTHVGNGGFYHYYFNSTGDTVATAPVALNQIGAKQLAVIVSQADAIFPGGRPPKDSLERQQFLESLGDDQLNRLDDLSEKFLAYPDDLTDLLFQHVQKNATDIEGYSEPSFE